MKPQPSPATAAAESPALYSVRVLRRFTEGAQYRPGDLCGWPEDMAYRLLLEELAEPNGWTPDPAVMKRCAAELFKSLEEPAGVPVKLEGRRLRVYQNLARALGVGVREGEVIRG